MLRSTSYTYLGPSLVRRIGFVVRLELCRPIQFCVDPVGTFKLGHIVLQLFHFRQPRIRRIQPSDVGTLQVKPAGCIVRWQRLPKVLQTAVARRKIAPAIPHPESTMVRTGRARAAQSYTFGLLKSSRAAVSLTPNQFGQMFGPRLSSDSLWLARRASRLYRCRYREARV